jgi:hypothetical protein
MEASRRDFLLQGLAFGATASNRSVPSETGARTCIDVQGIGAKGDGRNDDTHAIQAALDSLVDGGVCYLPRGDYLVSKGLRPRSGTTVCGDGYASRVMCHADGWTLEPTSNFGVLNIDGKRNVRITGLRLYGTKSAVHEKCPKLIYFEDAQEVTIDHCWLQHSAFEGIWSGGTQARNQGIVIEANFVDDVGFPAGKYVGLPAIQLNANDCVVIGNRLANVGTGIGASGARITLAGNVIRSFMVVGIGTGDAGESGSVSITGNVIQFEAGDQVTRIGILCGGGGGVAHVVNVCGNTISVKGDSSWPARCYRHTTAGFANFVGNTAEIQGAGVAFEVFGSRTGETVVLHNNVVQASAARPDTHGFVGLPNGAANRLVIRSSDNRVFGLDVSLGNYAFNYYATKGGDLDATCAADIADGGHVQVGANRLSDGKRVGPFFLASGPHQAFPAQAILFDAVAFSRTHFSNLYAAAEGTIVYVSDGLSGSRPLIGGGTGCVAVRQNGQWVSIS